MNHVFFFHFHRELDLSKIKPYCEYLLKNDIKAVYGNIYTFKPWENLFYFILIFDLYVCKCHSAETLGVDSKLKQTSRQQQNIYVSLKFQLKVHII